jgi:hypothetical protein
MHFLGKIVSALLALAVGGMGFVFSPTQKGSSPADAAAAFRAANLTPAVIPIFRPIVSLGVEYTFNETHKRALLGTNFTRPRSSSRLDSSLCSLTPDAETAIRPTWSIEGTNHITPHEMFVVAMVKSHLLLVQTVLMLRM